eukprot:1157076-Pelagomonas_calceolata.AAC.3
MPCFNAQHFAMQSASNTDSASPVLLPPCVSHAEILLPGGVHGADRFELDRQSRGAVQLVGRQVGCVSEQRNDAQVPGKGMLRSDVCCSAFGEAGMPVSKPRWCYVLRTKRVYPGCSSAHVMQQIKCLGQAAKLRGLQCNRPRAGIPPRKWALKVESTVGSKKCAHIHSVCDAFGCGILSKVVADLGQRSLQLWCSGCKAARVHPSTSIPPSGTLLSLSEDVDYCLVPVV